MRELSVARSHARELASGGETNKYVIPFFCTTHHLVGITLRLQRWRRFLPVALKEVIGSFSNDDGDVNEDVKKAIGLLRKTTTLHVHHSFLYISLPSLHEYDVKMPNCKFYGGSWRTQTSDDESLFLSLNLSAVLKKSTTVKFVYTCHFQQIGISAIKIEKTGTHFKTSSMLKLPN